MKTIKVEFTPLELEVLPDVVEDYMMQNNLVSWKLETDMQKDKYRFLTDLIAKMKDAAKATT